MTELTKQELKIKAAAVLKLEKKLYDLSLLSYSLSDLDIECVELSNKIADVISEMSGIVGCPIVTTGCLALPTGIKRVGWVPTDEDKDIFKNYDYWRLN